MVEKKQQSKRAAEQIFNKMEEKLRQYYAIPPDQVEREVLRNELQALEQEYQELTGKRVIY
ncbi:MAG: hypothetical protein ACYTEL_19645 [Planctomycetota bacterium]|jgi:S-adenosylhomocysteine hydrolase